MGTQDQFKEFARQCEAKGLQAIDYGGGHWQARGDVVVNYYPNAKRGPSVFVNGTQRKMPFHRPSVDDVLAFAQGKLPNVRLAERLSLRQSRAVRKRLMLKYPRCHWCEIVLSFATATLEHVVPLSRGGSNHDDNLRLACKPCNEKHANKIEKKPARRSESPDA